MKLRKGTPVGGITPGGYRKVGPDEYEKVEPEKKTSSVPARCPICSSPVDKSGRCYRCAYKAPSVQKSDDKCASCAHLGKCGADMSKCDAFQKSFYRPTQESFQIAQQYKQARLPGQVPGNRALAEAREAVRLAEQEPRADVMRVLLEQSAPVLTPARIVDNLGMPFQQQLQWARFLNEAATNAPNEVAFRQTLFQRFQNEKLDPALRSAIFQRSMNYARQVRKSIVAVYTADELLKAQVTPVGGITPGGYRKVAEDKYVKEEPGQAKPQLSLFDAQPKQKAKTPQQLVDHDNAQRASQIAETSGKHMAHGQAVMRHELAAESLRATHPEEAAEHDRKANEHRSKVEALTGKPGPRFTSITKPGEQLDVDVESHKRTRPVMKTKRGVMKPTPVAKGEDLAAEIRKLTYSGGGMPDRKVVATLITRVGGQYPRMSRKDRAVVLDALKATWHEAQKIAKRAVGRYYGRSGKHKFDEVLEARYLRDKLNGLRQRIVGPMKEELAKPNGGIYGTHKPLTANGLSPEHIDRMIRHMQSFGTDEEQAKFPKEREAQVEAVRRAYQEVLDSNEDNPEFKDVMLLSTLNRAGQIAAIHSVYGAVEPEDVQRETAKSLSKGGTPIGGITPKGYKKVAEGKYVKEEPGAKRQLSLELKPAAPKPEKKRSDAAMSASAEAHALSAQTAMYSHQDVQSEHSRATTLHHTAADVAEKEGHQEIADEHRAFAAKHAARADELRHADEARWAEQKRKQAQANLPGGMSLEEKVRAKTAMQYPEGGKQPLAVTKTGKPIHLKHQGKAAVEWWGDELHATTEIGHEHEAPKVIEHEGKHYFRAGTNSDTGSVSYQEYHPERHVLDEKTKRGGQIIRKDRTEDGMLVITVAGQPKYAGGDLPKTLDDPSYGPLVAQGFNSDTGRTYYRLDTAKHKEMAEVKPPESAKQLRERLGVTERQQAAAEEVARTKVPFTSESKPAESQESAPVEEYVARISNPKKKKYAKQYLEFLRGTGKAPDASGLPADTARTVRMMLADAVVAKSRRFVVSLDRLGKACKACGCDQRFVMRAPDELRKPEGGLAKRVAEGDDALDDTMKAGDWATQVAQFRKLRAAKRAAQAKRSGK